MRAAAELCRIVQSRMLSVSRKDAGNYGEPVTIADYGSQAILCRALQAQYPNDAVVAEESALQFQRLLSAQQRAQVLQVLAQVLGQAVTEQQVLEWLDFGRGKLAARTWVIDPIDGTKGFIAGRHYAIACALLQGGQLQQGLIAAPAYGNGAGALFYTDKGAAWCLPLAGGSAARIRVSERREAQTMRAVQSYARAHASKSRMAQARGYAGLDEANVIEMHSMEKYALVACGDAEVYMRLPRAGAEYAHKIWDHAAGVALVQQAGGIATDLDGGALEFGRGQHMPNLGMVVSNGRQHERLVTAVQRVLRP